MADHPTPWRLGRKLRSTALGAVTIYDGSPEGDGGEPGVFVAVAFSRELGERIVAAVNALEALRDWVEAGRAFKAAQAVCREAHQIGQPEEPREALMAQMLAAGERAHQAGVRAAALFPEESQ